MNIVDPSRAGLQMARNLPPPSVLLVDQTGQLGGAEQILLTAAPGLGSECEVFLFEDGPLRPMLELANVATRLPRRNVALAAIRRDRGLLHAVPALPAMFHLLRELAAAARRHDLVVANSQKAFMLAAVAARIARRPLVWWLHDILSPRHFGRTQIRLAVMAANIVARRVLVPSMAVASAFEAAGGAGSRVQVVANGVKLPGRVTPRHEARNLLGIPAHFTLGVFSRIAPWKGQHVVLQALAQLPDVHAVIAGAPLFGEADYLARLEEIVVDLGLQHRVHFLGHRNDVAELMRAVDVVVHPSVEAEPFGLTLVEAMLQETPIIATNNGAAPEILHDGQLGSLVPSGDPAALAAALRAVRSDPGMAADRARLARRSAEVRFAADRLQQDLRSALQECVTACAT